MKNNRAKSMIFTGILALGIIINTNAQTNKYFMHNTYMYTNSLHVINDSLRVHFKTSTDFDFISDKQVLKEKLPYQFNNILAYGKIKKEFDYDLIVIIHSNDKELPSFIEMDNILALDTVLDGHIYYFIAIAERANTISTLKKELLEIMGSVKVGDNYLDDIPGLMDLWRLKPALKGYNAIINYPVSSIKELEMNIKPQMERTLASFLGDYDVYDNLIKEYEGRDLQENIIELIDRYSKREEDVYNEILSVAKEHQIIMINEDHQIRRHRKFVKSLLVDLKNIGYSYLALEALSNPKGDSILNSENGYILAECGYYIQEQNFANLIRKAKELGYTFVSYENVDDEKDRELGQAENLYNKTFAVDDNAKVLVLAGGGHIRETPDRNGKKWMAAIFKENYDIDPMTISQAWLNIYRNAFNEELLLVNSSYFDHNLLNSVNYLLINNMKREYKAKVNHNFEYLNQNTDKIQINLYYGREVKEIDAFDKYVPFLTTVLEPGETFKGHLPHNEFVYLIAYDKHGRQVDFVKTAK